MAKRFEVGVRISGDSRGAEQAAKRSEGAFKRLGNTIKNNLLVSTAALALGVRALVRGFRSLIDAANTQEDAIRALDAALRPLGESAAGVSKSLQEQAAALQKVTTAGDETIIKGQALIATFTQNEEEIKRATVAALDLSAAVGVDLNAAFLLMGKAASGETSTLSRYGVILGEGIPATEKFTAVLGLLEEKMGGRAQAAADTFSGRMSQLGNALSDLQENLGFALTENEGLRESIEDATKFVQANESAIRQWAAFAGGVFSEVLGGIADKFTQLGTGIGLLIVKIQELSGVNEKFSASQSAVEATAKRLGITVEEVRNRMSKLGGTIGEVDGAATKAGEDLGVMANKITQAGNAADEAEDHFKNATEAAVGLGNALGEVTSVELSLEIGKINEALLESKELLGANSDEYIRLEEIGRRRIESLQERILNLRDGLGDLKTETEDAGVAMGSYATRTEEAAASTDRLAASAERSTVALATQARASGGFSQNLLGGRSTFAQIGGGTFTYSTPVPTVRTTPNGRLVV